MIVIWAVLQRMAYLMKQSTPEVLLQIVQLVDKGFLIDFFFQAEDGIRDVSMFRREIISQCVKKPKTSFTFTLLLQTPERVLHDRRSPAKIEKPLGCKRVACASRNR